MKFPRDTSPSIATRKMLALSKKDNRWRTIVEILRMLNPLSREHPRHRLKQRVNMNRTDPFPIAETAVSEITQGCDAIQTRPCRQPALSPVRHPVPFKKLLGQVRPWMDYQCLTGQFIANGEQRHIAAGVTFPIATAHAHRKCAVG